MDISWILFLVAAAALIGLGFGVWAMGKRPINVNTHVEQSSAPVTNVASGGSGAGGIIGPLLIALLGLVAVGVVVSALVSVGQSLITAMSGPIVQPQAIPMPQPAMAPTAAPTSAPTVAPTAAPTIVATPIVIHDPVPVPVTAPDYTPVIALVAVIIVLVDVGIWLRIKTRSLDHEIQRRKAGQRPALKESIPIEQSPLFDEAIKNKHS